jgi:CMP/dCMP kinase
MNVPVITIDGPAGVGKGTLTRMLAVPYGFAYLDTGLLYRLVAQRAIEKGVAPEDAAGLTDCIVPEDLRNPALRQESLGVMASRIAAVPAVRQALLDYQRGFAVRPPDGARGVILDGRDTGTVICPEAPAKLFLTASAEIRAERRLKELQERGDAAIYDTILKEIRERDARDQSRAVAPLVPAADAIVLDTSHKTVIEVFEEATGIVNKRLRDLSTLSARPAGSLPHWVSCRIVKSNSTICVTPNLGGLAVPALQTF